MKNIVLFGLGDFAQLVYYFFSIDSSYRVVAFTIHKSYMKCSQFMGLPIICFEEMVENYPPDSYEMFVAIGYRSMRSREEIYQEVKSKGYKLVNYISHRAIIDGQCTVGDNNLLMSNAHVEPFVTIGNNNIFWSDSLICHNSMLGNHNFIAAKVIVGGFSTVGNKCFIGFDATIAQHIKIADESLIGAKSLILADTDNYGKYLGIPGRKVSSHENEGILIDRVSE
jgi:UDP-N-acetylbacillosamine N-acetyltransferase